MTIPFDPTRRRKGRRTVLPATEGPTPVDICDNFESSEVFICTVDC